MPQLVSRERSWRSVLLVLCGVALGQVLQAGLAGQAQAPPPVADNPELAKIYAEDQADRKPAPGAVVDWHAVGDRDQQRERRVKELIGAEALKTGADFYHAAMVLQHAPQAEDYLLAHELCIVAIGKGEPRAKWLAAATEDRFLMHIGRPQRFATQYRSSGPNQPLRLYDVDPAATDAMRKQFDAPTLAEAKAREAEINKRK